MKLIMVISLASSGDVAALAIEPERVHNALEDRVNRAAGNRIPLCQSILLGAGIVWGLISITPINAAISTAFMAASTHGIPAIVRYGLRASNYMLLCRIMLFSTGIVWALASMTVINAAITIIIIGLTFFWIYHAQRVITKIPLETAIEFWLNEFKTAFPKITHETLWASFERMQFLTDPAALITFYNSTLSQAQKEMLKIFLVKLTETQDYKEAATHNNLTFKVMKMLESAAIYEKFRTNMFLILADDLSRCGDKAMLIFGKIELQRRLDCMPETANLAEVAKLLIGAERVDLLDAIARKSIAELGLGDHVEVFLYYQLQLKKDLDLPISTEGMLYAGVAGISKDRLVAAKNEVLAKSSTKEHISAILIKYDIWNDRLKSRHAAEFEAINEEVLAQIDAIDSHLSEGMQLAQLTILATEQKIRTEALLATLTQQYITEYLSSNSS